MDCNAAAFAKAIQNRASEQVFRYLEIGCAWGGTVAGISQHLERTRPGRWQSVGIDKREGGWVYRQGDFVDTAGPMFGAILESGVSLNDVALGRIYLNEEGSLSYLPFCRDQFDLVLVDACHSKHCCSLDFDLAAPHVKPGGFVFFHDADPASQGLDLQPHCQRFIEVREFLIEHGFLPSVNPGWTLIDDIQPSDRQQRGCVVIQKN